MTGARALAATAARHDEAGLETVVIDAAAPRTGIAPREIWRHRELLALFVRRQLAARYRQMALGTLWIVLEPLAQLVLINVVFGVLLRVSSNGYPYPVYAFAGLTPWWLFSRTLMTTAGCLQDNMALVSKVYFPRLLLALAGMAREYVDSLVAFALLLAVGTASGYPPGWKALLAPAMLALVSLFGLGLGLWVAALMVRFRDVRPALGLVLQAGMYATPIVYAASLVPAPLRPWYELNPMLWAVEGFRWLLLDAPLAATGSLGGALAFAVLALLGGLKVFARQERMSVDVQ